MLLINEYNYIHLITTFKRLKMGRFLKIAVYIAVLFLGYLWIATLAKSCNKTSTADASDDTELIDDIADGDEFEDDFFGDDETESAEDSDEMGGGDVFESTDVVDSEPIDYTEVDEIIRENKPAKTQNTTRRTTSTSTVSKGTSSGQYLLLAGSYLIEENAEQMVRKLKKIGYSNAEIVVFDMSQYHSVCAGRFQSKSSARQESSSLKRKGVDNYVHTRQ